MNKKAHITNFLVYCIMRTGLFLSLNYYYYYIFIEMFVFVVYCYTRLSLSLFLSLFLLIYILNVFFFLALNDEKLLYSLFFFLICFATESMSYFVPKEPHCTVAKPNWVLLLIFFIFLFFSLQIMKLSIYNFLIQI